MMLSIARNCWFVFEGAPKSDREAQIRPDGFRSRTLVFSSSNSMTGSVIYEVLPSALLCCDVYFREAVLLYVP